MNTVYTFKFLHVYVGLHSHATCSISLLLSSVLNLHLIMLTGRVFCVCISFSVIIATFCYFDQGTPLDSFILIMYIVVGLYFP